MWFYQFIAGYHMGLLDSGLEKYEQLYPLPFYEFLEFSDEQILSLLNDYIFHDKKARGI